jgi:hypothetical protein
MMATMSGAPQPNMTREEEEEGQVVTVSEPAALPEGLPREQQKVGSLFLRAAPTNEIPEDLGEGECSFPVIGGGHERGQFTRIANPCDPLVFRYVFSSEKLFTSFLTSMFGGSFTEVSLIVEHPVVDQEGREGELLFDVACQCLHNGQKTYVMVKLQNNVDDDPTTRFCQYALALAPWYGEGRTKALILLNHGGENGPIDPAQGAPANMGNRLTWKSRDVHGHWTEHPERGEMTIIDLRHEIYELANGRKAKVFDRELDSEASEWIKLLGVQHWAAMSEGSS